MGTPIFDRLAAEHLWPHDPVTGPVSTVGRHYDADDDGIADQADPDPHGLDPYSTGDGSYPSWPGGWDEIDPTPQPADGEAADTDRMPAPDGYVTDVPDVACCGEE